jgi:alkanesulfonate monooxygenase SsuD/methylene tetrahydromethanopterin reductase-like flavin-dependent oxidoreductase (luciferase family)
LELGRDFGKIEKSWTGDVLIVNEEEKAKLEKLKLRRFTTEQYLDKHIVGTLEECVSKIQAYIELGVTYFTVSVRTLKEDLELFADEVIKRAT